MLDCKRAQATPDTMPSTVIRHFEYDDERSELRIQFQSGRVYNYKNVPRDQYDAMKRAFAKGEYFNRHIKDKYPFVRVD
jgi:lysyl-tRNA synthetase class 2